MANEDITYARKIITLFAKSGYHKVTMQDIAKAIGVSRQSVYKKYGNKENCYAWTIDTYLRDMYSRMFDVMNRDSDKVLDQLHQIFNIFIGEAVDIVNHQRGTETLDDVLKATLSSQDDWHVRFTNRLADFLTKHRCVNRDKSLGVAMTLISASKGLLLVEPTKQQFQYDMDTIFNSILVLG